MTERTKKIRSIMCGVASFLLSVSLTLLFLCLTVRITALNPSYAVTVAESSDYAELMQKELKEEFVSYGNACNVDESFFDGLFDDVITVEQIESDTKESLYDFFNNEVKDGTDTSNIEEKMLTALEAYAQDKGFALSESVVNNLREMSEEMGDLYNAYVGIFASSYFGTAANLVSRYMPVLNYAVAGLAVFSVLAFIVIRLSYKKAKNYTRYYIYATAGSALMLFVAPAAALMMKIGSRINLANASLHGFASGYINYILAAFIAAAVIMAVICASLVFIRSKAVKDNR